MTSNPKMPTSFRAQTMAAVLLVLPLLAGCGGEVEGAQEDERATDEAALSGSYPVGTPLKTTTHVNLRAQPSVTASILAVIPPNTQVLSASANPQVGWYGVTANGKTGWVSGAFLTRPSTPGPVSGFTRAQVRQLISAHMRPGQAASADDFLDPGLTTQALVNAVGWIATHNPPAWEISSVNSNHHFDPAAHSGGFAADLYNKDPSEDLAFIQLLNKNPYVVEVGLSGEYVRLGREITGKFYFTENAPTHIHVSVKQAYGTLQ